MRFYIFIALENIVPKVGLISPTPACQHALEIPGMHNPHIKSSQKSPLKSDEKKWLGGLQDLYGIVLSWNSAKRIQEIKHFLKTSQNSSAQFHAIASFCSAKSEEKISLLNFSPVSDDLIRNDELAGFRIC